MTEFKPDRLEKERSRLQSADIAADDRELLDEFDTRLGRRNKTGDAQHANHLRRVRFIAEHRSPPDSDDDDDGDDGDVSGDPTDNYHGVALADVLTDVEAAEDVLDWINERTHNGAELSEKTRTHYRGAVRMFGRVMTDVGPRGEEIPDAVRVIPGGDPRQKSEKDTAPRPGEIHWWDPDIITMLEDGGLSSRDRALVALGWDSGARPEELLSLTWGDVSTERGFYRITVGGKDHPERDPLCVVATPYLRKWLEFNHPANDRPERFTSETPIWSHYDDVEQVSMSRIRDVFRDLRDDLALSKPLTPKWLRKSRASIVAQRPNMNQTKLENRFGWVRGSQVAAHYITRFNGETDADVAEGDGLPEGVLDRETDERDKPAPVQCPNCEEWTPRHRDACLFCGAEFATEEVEEADVEATLQEEVAYREKRDAFMADVVEDDAAPEELDLAVKHGDVLSENPELVDLAEELRDELDAAMDG